MTKYLKLSLIVAVCALFTVSSCKKYPDGPAFSLSSKKARLVNTWKFVKVFDVTTGEDLTADFDGETVEFKKDGNFAYFESSGTMPGKWTFDSKKEDILISEPAGFFTWQIRRLTGKEFWFRDDVGTADSYEYHLAPK